MDRYGFSESDLETEVAEEFDSAAGRGREWFDAEGFGFRRLPKIRDAEFAKLCNRLRVAKWQRENVERKRANARRYAAKADVRARAAELAKLRRAKAAAAWPPVICSECGKAFRRKRKGPAPKFCGEACRQRAYYQATTPGARRCARRSEPRPTTCSETGCTDSVKAKGLCRKHHQAAWRAARRTT